MVIVSPVSEPTGGLPETGVIVSVLMITVKSAVPKSPCKPVTVIV